MLALGKSDQVYPTDMTAAQWEIICPMLPLSLPIGADRWVDMRKIIWWHFLPQPHRLSMANAAERIRRVQERTCASVVKNNLRDKNIPRKITDSARFFPVPPIR